MKIFKGKIVDFKGSRDSEIGYLSIKCSKTRLVFNVPCQSDCIAKDLDRHFGDVISGYMYQEVYTQYNEAGDIIMGITPVKDKPGKTPLKNDKKAPNTPYGVEHRMRMRGKLLALAKELGFKEVPLKGAIIRISEGTDIM